MVPRSSKQTRQEEGVKKRRAMAWKEKTLHKTSRYICSEERQKGSTNGKNKREGFITFTTWMVEQRPRQCSLTACKAADLCPLVTHFSKKVVSKVHWWGLQFYPFLSSFQSKNTRLKSSDARRFLQRKEWSNYCVCFLKWQSVGVLEGLICD